jgi:IS4 transposase
LTEPYLPPHRNSYQPKLRLILDGDVLSSKHRTFKKNYETEIRVDSIRLPLNHFMQETLANMLIGFLKTLKQVEGEAPTSMEIKIKKLPKQVEVDAHTYP